MQLSSSNTKSSKIHIYPIFIQELLEKREFLRQKDSSWIIGLNSLDACRNLDVKVENFQLFHEFLLKLFTNICNTFDYLNRTVHNCTLIMTHFRISCIWRMIANADLPNCKAFRLIQFCSVHSISIFFFWLIEATKYLF